MSGKIFPLDVEDQIAIDVDDSKHLDSNKDRRFSDNDVHKVPSQASSIKKKAKQTRMASFANVVDEIRVDYGGTTDEVENEPLIEPENSARGGKLPALPAEYQPRFSDVKEADEALTSAASLGIRSIPLRDERSSDTPSKAGFALQSKAKSSTSMNTNNEYRRGEEIVENTVTKLIGVKTIVMALIVNVLFGVAIIYLASDTGLVVYFWGSLFRQTGAVLFQIWMNFGHLLTYQSMNDSTAHYIGYLISQPDGYSLAAVGFAHSNVIEKLFFPAKLSYRSTCRKMLRYHVMIWIFHSILILLTVFSSATITTDILRIDSNRMACNIYGLDSVLSDRGFPTLEVVMGAGEYIFGTALGIQRSEVSVPITRHVFPPQLTDDAYDDQNIVGSGFITDISTTCKCSTSNNPADLILAGARADIVPGLQSMYATLGGVAGLANHLAVNSTAITATTILSGFNKCGGRNRTSPALSICKTVMSNHKRGTIVAAYMTDGTPASIAIREAIIRTEGETVSINWPYQALVNLLGSEYAAIELPQVYPGSVNPLIWWTTKDMQSVNTGLLEPGLETTFSLLLRTAIQRSYSTKASYCAQNIIDPNSAVLKMSTQGIWIGAIFSIGQIIVLFVCIFGSSHWFRSSNPILPCIRLASDGTFFTLMLSGSFTSDLLASLPPSTPNSEVWRILDVKVRLGASILAKDDPDMGFIILDKPKLITNFEREKKYV